MLDKIVVSLSEKKAVMIFTDRPPFTLSTDEDITLFLLWFLNSNLVKLIMIDGKPQLFYVNLDDEITQEIPLEKVA